MMGSYGVWSGRRFSGLPTPKAAGRHSAKSFAVGPIRAILARPGLGAVLERRLAEVGKAGSRNKQTSIDADGEKVSFER